MVGVSNEPVQLGNPLSFTILKEDTPIVIDTNTPIGGKLSEGCVALLGLDAIKMLDIDLNHAVSNNPSRMDQISRQQTGYSNEVRSGQG